MKFYSVILGILLWLVTDLNLQAQGFVNLNFEAAKVTGYLPGTYNIPATNAIPSWTPYGSQVWYDSRSLGGEMISINDTNRGFSFVPLQGKFSVSLNGITTGAPPPNDYFAAIGQTGLIPTNSQSITFYGATDVTPFGFQLTFAGQLIPIIQTGSTPSYGIYGGDVSPFAGQTGELLFTALAGYGGHLDNIQFSSSPIPEPTALGLFALGGLLIGLRRRQIPSR